MNSILKHLNDNGQSVAWMCRKFKFSRTRFHRLMQLEDDELYSELTIEEADKLEELIPNIKSKLKGE